MRRVAERVRVLRDAELIEDEFPVVALDLGARAATEQDDPERLRIRDIRSQVDEVLPCPPCADRRTERLLLPYERDRGDDRDEALQQRSAKHGHEPAERQKDHVPGLVEDEIRQVQERVQRIGADRRARELYSPDGKPHDQREARPVGARHWRGAGASTASTSRRRVVVLRTPCAIPSGAISRSPACIASSRPSSRNTPSPSITW